ncbi:hypothetical protein [Streptomyces sp. DH24]|uniref:hypothetical protein n=1 Tax=Streptomyces sp. DH24 TaxID=3040123 RepID=UPI0024433A7C|nr:hypothetical protein [Streptomyces sp. DH24]MDG9718541.1 hypothetical protein [Streptomyces sp. DH24]
MLRRSGEYGTPRSPGGGRDPHRVRLLALVGAVACAVLLPLAVASAGSVRDERRGAPAGPPPGDAARPGARDDGKAPVGGPGRPQAPAVPAESPGLGLGGGTAVRCGPELTSPDGIEAQTCILAQGADTWARTYYRNATGDALTAVLSLMGPAGRAVRMHCAVGAEDAPAMCETPREPARDGLAAYTAVTEFAGRGGSGPLLLRSGSNSPLQNGS